MLFTLAVTTAVSGEVTDDTILFSDDFESYSADEELDGQGRWQSSRGSGENSGVTVVEGSSTSGRGANERVVRYYDDSGSDPHPVMRRSFPEESTYAVKSTFLLRLNELDGDVGMHNVVLRGTGGAATRFRFGPSGLILLGSAEEPGGERKQSHRIIDRPVAGDWYQVVLTADPKTQTTWARVTNLDRDDAGQRGEAPPTPFFADVSSLSRWAVERASMTTMDVSIDDVTVRVVPAAAREPAVDLSVLEMAADAELSEGARARMADGRIEGEQAVLLEAGSIAWETPGLSDHHHAEFWFNPVSWNPVLGDEVTLARFQIGDDLFVLRKPANRSELQLERDGQAVQAYPTYAWDHGDWYEGGGGTGVRGLIRRSVPWHHVHVAVSGGRISMTVDGFPARRVETAAVSGALSRLELHGQPGTTFAAVAAEAGTPMEASELRDRYITLFLNEPRIMRNLVTVPYLRQPPSIDGQVDEAEWANAARLIGFSNIGRDGVVTEELVGYIGYDDERVYLALVTPAGESVSDDAGDQPMWEREAMVMTLSPPFVSGEDPRRATQLVGDPAGHKTQLKVLPTRDEQWQAVWDWYASTDGQGWQGELAAAFDDLDFPTPSPADMWGLNVENPNAGATWSHIEVEPNLGNIRFREGAPAVRPMHLRFDEGSAKLEIEIVGGENVQDLIVGMQLFGAHDRLPRETVETVVSVGPGEPERAELTLDLEGQDDGRVALFVRDGHLFIYYHSVKFPAVEGR
ncbi:hypothetical protein ACERK3_05615 [Phycisphaerales bacterium AB-hyl4]|uniref:Concanavalin A-like lectin/glucanase superfamily protein n=1 Tax=Natronomicrosphaera hydrolytica TaxID=3242702 RepID=A0ABV4U2F4_9BACT